MNTYPWVF